MCGIFGTFGRNNMKGLSLLMNNFEMFLHENMKRGTDGFGMYAMYDKYSRPYTYYNKVTKESIPVILEAVEEIFNKMKQLNNIKTYAIQCICRAQPETEVETDDNNSQPVIIKNSSIVHNGAINEKMKKDFLIIPHSDIDSEIIIHMLDRYREILGTENVLSLIDGGFAFHYVHKINDYQFYNLLATKYHPLYLYQMGDSYVYSSTNVKLNGLENWNKRKLKSNTFIEYDGMYIEHRESSFIPYYKYPGSKTPVDIFNKYVSKNNETKKKKIPKIHILVSASGGIDSTTNIGLAINDLVQKFDSGLISKGSGITIINFDYGAKGSSAEKQAIKDIYLYFRNKLKDSKLIDLIAIEIKLIDLKNIYKSMDCKLSQLFGDNKVTTGETEELKSTVAWVPVRNLLFSTILAGIAETKILEEDFDEVYIASGWNQLSEEGFYPDNSQMFVETFEELLNTATLVGNKIHNVFYTRNIMKYEQWAIAKYYDFLEAFKYTISCDCPVKIKNKWYNCDSQCGSTILSRNAVAKWEDIEDPRKFKYNKEVKLINKYENRNNQLLKYETEIQSILDRINWINL